MTIFIFYFIFSLGLFTGTLLSGVFKDTHSVFFRLFFSYSWPITTPIFIFKVLKESIRGKL